MTTKLISLRCTHLLSLALLLVSLVSTQTSEKDWEQEFLAIPSPSYAYEHLSYYTSLPHVAGKHFNSPH